MEKRCRSICGDDREHCFINNRKQIDCIADMVINKVFAVTSNLELIREENSKEMTDMYLKNALHVLHELNNWIKYLQVAKDIKLLSSISEEKKTDRRRENRYPLPEIYQRYLKLSISDSGIFIPVRLINFSSHGLLFAGARKLEIDSSHICILAADHAIKKEVSFNIRIKHNESNADGYLTGAEIDGISDQSSFDFFNNVMSFIEAISKNRS